MTDGHPRDPAGFSTLDELPGRCSSSRCRGTGRLRSIAKAEVGKGPKRVGFFTPLRQEPK